MNHNPLPGFTLNENFCEELGRCHITKANYVSFEVIIIIVHKMIYLLPCNKTTKKLRLIFNKLLLQTIEKLPTEILDYRRNFISTSFMGNSNRLCKKKTNFLDLEWHITESVPLQRSKCFPNSQVTSYYLCVLSG